MTDLENAELFLTKLIHEFKIKYNSLYPERCSPFLLALNEKNEKKFVCRALQPINYAFEDFFNAEGIARFVADYFQYVPYSRFRDEPQPWRIRSFRNVMERRAGNCFELANVLASFLIGAGYNAFIVNGYATEAVSRMDQSSIDIPWIEMKSHLRLDMRMENEMGGHDPDIREFDDDFFPFNAFNELDPSQNEAYARYLAMANCADDTSGKQSDMNTEQFTISEESKREDDENEKNLNDNSKTLTYSNEKGIGKNQNSNIPVLSDIVDAGEESNVGKLSENKGSKVSKRFEKKSGYVHEEKPIDSNKKNVDLPNKGKDLVDSSQVTTSAADLNSAIIAASLSHDNLREEYKLGKLMKLVSQAQSITSTTTQSKQSLAVSIEKHAAEAAAVVPVVNDEKVEETDVIMPLVHCWVLLLPTKFEVRIPQFIEPTTGEFKNVFDSGYKGIESVWNNVDYWLNMHNRSDDFSSLNFDFTDTQCWEPLFNDPFETVGRWLRDWEKDESANCVHTDLESRIDDIVLVARAPYSIPFYINAENYNDRFPLRSKMIKFKNGSCERYNEFVHKDCLGLRCIVNGTGESEEIVAQEHRFYYSRTDHLIESRLDFEKLIYSEEFEIGRLDALRFHKATFMPEDDMKSTYLLYQSKNNRKLVFYSQMRTDRLRVRYCSAFDYREYYSRRLDGLVSRRMIFLPEISTNVVGRLTTESIMYICDRFEQTNNADN